MQCSASRVFQHPQKHHRIKVYSVPRWATCRSRLLRRWAQHRYVIFYGACEGDERQGFQHHTPIPVTGQKRMGGGTKIVSMILLPSPISVVCDWRKTFIYRVLGAACIFCLITRHHSIYFEQLLAKVTLMCIYACDRLSHFLNGSSVLALKIPRDKEKSNFLTRWNIYSFPNHTFETRESDLPHPRCEN